MPYGNPTKTVQSVCTDVSPLDDKPYWLKVRTQIQVKEWGRFNAMVKEVQEWLKSDVESAADMPEEVAEAYASLIVDWNIDEDQRDGFAGASSAKRQVTAAAVQELNLGDLIAVADELTVIFGSGDKTPSEATEARKNGLSSTNGSRASTESSRLEDASISTLTSASLDT